jgi:hypothetical protein
MRTRHQKLNCAYIKAQRAICSDTGIDPVSGYSLEDIKTFVMDCPLGEEVDSDAVLNKIYLLETVTK